MEWPPESIASNRQRYRGGRRAVQFPVSRNVVLLLSSRLAIRNQICVSGGWRPEPQPTDALETISDFVANVLVFVTWRQI